MGSNAPPSAESPPPDAAPLLAVALVTWNRREDLRRLLERLDRQTIRDRTEIVIVDNASTDGTPEMLRDWPTPLRLFPLPKNEGPSVGRNLTLLAIKARCCCFIDTDAYPKQEDLLERQVAKLDENRDVAGCSTAIYWDDACSDLWLSGGFFTPYGHYDPSRAKSVFEKPMWLSTCFATFRTADLRRARGFDPHYVYGYEDADIGMRVRKETGGFFWIDQERSVVHAMSDAGRNRDWRHFHTMFKYFEYHRHYWTLANHGLGAMLRNILVLPFRRRDLWAAYLCRLTKWQWLLALGWYPLVNLLALPAWMVLQRRDHLKRLLKRVRRERLVAEEELAVRT